MGPLAQILGTLLVAAGLAFFAAGTAGLWRFPDALSRLHALTKADNLGLGLVLAGVAVIGGSWLTALQLLLTWLAVLLSSAVIAHLIARTLLKTEGPQR